MLLVSNKTFFPIKNYFKNLRSLLSKALGFSACKINAFNNKTISSYNFSLLKSLIMSLTFPCYSLLT